jgi:hypothetical protein
LKVLSQENLTRNEAILSMCYQCCGGYEEGPFDCQSFLCSLYSFMPYRDGRARKEMTPEDKEALMVRFAKAKEERKKHDRA